MNSIGKIKLADHFVQNENNSEISPDYNNKLWQKVCEDLCNYYGKDLFNSWFDKIIYDRVNANNIIILKAPSDFIRDWVASNYNQMILNFLHKHNSEIRGLEILTDKSIKAKSKDVALGTEPLVEINDLNLIEKDDFTSFLDPRFTFDNFVIGRPNELAYAASLAVAESSTSVAKSNPLFLYGGVGLGKTHLMHAIAWHVHKTNPERKVLYLSAEKFMYRFIKSLRNKEIMSFKEEFRSVDILMIDDIQFICGKDSTQEEFFHTFNAIIDNGKQMVITCDRSPSDLDNIEDRIKSRLGWGLVADVHSTTYELRLGILQSKLEQMKIMVPSCVIEFLASKITSNVRELEGALNKVIAHSTLVGREVTLDSTKEILRDLLRTSEKAVTIDDIQKKIATRYNIKKSDMSSSSRLRSVARPRQIAMYLCKKLTPRSLQDIGLQFGKKDHSTVIHAIKKIDELIVKDAELREEIELLSKILQS